MFMGAGKYDNKHAVGIMLNKKWRHEYIIERATTATIVVNHQGIKLMSVYFHHSGYATNTSKNVHNDRETHDKLQKKHTDCWRRLQCRTGNRHGTKCTSVGKYTLNEGNKRGDWMKHWLMLQGYTAFDTMSERHLGNKRPTDLQKLNEKQIEYILTERRYLTYNKDAEANDMIHMGSDPRCGMATFMITTPEKSSHCKTTRKIRYNKA